jgi:aquaporin Z
MKKYISEFIGAFFLVLVVVLSANNSQAEWSPLAVGSILMALIYGLAPISGAHFNPAISLAYVMCGKTDRIDFLYYIVAQLLGAVVGALIGAFLLSGSGVMEIIPYKHGVFSALMAEFLGTFVLVLVVLQVMISRRSEGNQIYGLAIGATTIGARSMVLNISLAAFNPALALGMSIAGMSPWPDIWIYLVGALLGSAAAASLHQSFENENDTI